MRQIATTVIMLFSCACGKASAAACTPPINVAVIGDSISLNYPAILQDLLGTEFWFKELAVGGAATSAIKDSWTNSVKGRGFQGLLVMGGVNDKFGGVAQATTEGNLSTIYTEAAAAGIDVYAMTVLPVPDPDPPRVAANALIPTLNAWIVAQPDITVVDMWTLFGGDSPNLSLYAPDLLHPSTAGSTLIATTLAGVIQ